MATYQIELPSGKTVPFESDSPPTEKDYNDLVAAAEPQQPSSSAIGALLRNAGVDIGPALGGLAAAGAAGSRMPGGPIPKLVGGALVGGATTAGLSYLERKALGDKINEQLAQDVAQHPYASVLGSLLGSGFRPKIGPTIAKDLASRVLPAALGAGQQAAMEVIQNKDQPGLVGPGAGGRIAQSAGIGALLNEPTKLGNAALRVGQPSILPKIETAMASKTPTEANATANEIAAFQPGQPENLSGFHPTESNPSATSELGNLATDPLQQKVAAKVDSQIPALLSDLTNTEQAGTTLGNPKSVIESQLIRKVSKDAALESADAIDRILSARENGPAVEKAREAARIASLNEVGGAGDYRTGEPLPAAPKTPPAERSTVDEAAKTALADKLRSEAASAQGKPDNPETGPTLGDLVGERVTHEGFTGQLIKLDNGFGVLEEKGVAGKPTRIMEVSDTSNDPATPAKDVKVVPVKNEPQQNKEAPATYAGFQEGMADLPGFHLWNLTKDIPGHPAGSTVSSNTLEAAGFKVPKTPGKNQAGFITPATAARISAPVIGAGIGYQFGADQKEKEKNALLGATIGLGGAIAPTLLKHLSLSNPAFYNQIKAAAEDLYNKPSTQSNDAVQKQGASKIPVLDSSGDGQALGARDSLLERVAAARQEVQVPEAPLDRANFRDKAISDIQKVSAKALESKSVDVEAKKFIRQRMAETMAVDAADLGGVHENTIPTERLAALRDEIKIAAEIGRSDIKARKDAIEGEKDIIKEQITGSRGGSLEDIPLESHPGEDRTALQGVSTLGSNFLTRGVNALRQGFRHTQNRDVNLSNLDGGDPSGPLQTILGAKVDIDYQKEQNLKDAWKSPIREAIKDKSLNEKSMARVNIYALDRRNQSNPDLPNSHLEDTGVKPETVLKIRQEGLTPDEQAYYDSVRKVLDDKSYPEVARVMREEFGIDVQKEKDYWPIQRDYSKMPVKVQHPEPSIEPGTEASLDELKNSLVNDFRQTNTSKPAQGQTKTRVEGAGGAVNLKANVIDRHLNQAAHLVAFSHDLNALGSVARSKMFGEKYGRNGQKFVNDWLDSTARDADPVGSKSNPTINAAIRNTGVGILAIRFLSQIKHISNVAIATREVGPSALMEGMTQSLTGQGRAFLKTHFPEVYQRAGGEESIQQLIEGGRISRIQGKFFLPERILDQHLSRASVLGAYMNELARQGIDPSRYAEIPINRRAQAKALVISRKVVTSSLRKDAPQALSRGALTGGNMTLKNAIFQFQSTMLKNAGYAKHEIYDMGLKKGDYRAASTAAATMLGILAMVASLTVGQRHLTSMAVEKFSGKHQKPGEGLPTELADDIVVEGIRQIPVVGPFVSATVAHGQTGIPVLDTYTHGLNSLGKYSGITTDQYGKPVKGKLRTQAGVDALTFGGTALGVPGASTVGQLISRSQ